jgi:hypothetical protein
MKNSPITPSPVTAALSRPTDTYGSSTEATPQNTEKTATNTSDATIATAPDQAGDMASRREVHPSEQVAGPDGPSPALRYGLPREPESTGPGQLGIASGHSVIAFSPDQRARLPHGRLVSDPRSRHGVSDGMAARSNSVEFAFPRDVTAPFGIHS